MKLLNYLLMVLLLSACGTPRSESPNESSDVIWYTQAAAKWNDALPLGNGRIGVMVFGDPSSERIQLNDDSMWPGDVEGWEHPEGDSSDLRAIRELLFEGRHEEADRLFVEKFSNLAIVRSHQTLGDLHLDLGHGSVTDYRRELDLAKAIAKVSYRSQGHLVTEKVFVSHPHQGIVVHIESEAPEGLNGRLRLSRPEDSGHPTASTEVDPEGRLLMKGMVTQMGGKFRSEDWPITDGIRFETLLEVENRGGEVLQGKEHLELKGVREATIYLVSSSSWYTEDLAGQNARDLEQLSTAGLARLEKAHTRDHSSLYRRMDLQLDGERPDSVPTDVRLKAVQQGVPDQGLEELLFNYGRYLLIGSSREGTNPANLQGLWNPHITAPWNADYHLNINLQMNYWLADVCGLGELNRPLFDYVDRLVESGKETATGNFGCRGSFMPHATDLWVPTWMRAPRTYWGCSMGAPGWMMQHYWEHYRFSGDLDFLRERAYPALREVAQFYSDWLIEDPRDGRLISAPSTSPENRFLDGNGTPVSSCLGSAMDQQVIEEVFDNYLKSCEILGVSEKLVEVIQKQFEQLRPGFVIGEDGRILEWDRPYEELEPGHRHMSHLYGFHPGSAVSPDRDPEVFSAVRRTLDHRLANGGAGTGWSRAWLINCSARLQDGEMAYEHIQKMFQRSIGLNLFDLHPPFQIDGNFGYTAGIAEMLVQSYEEGIVRLLPAIPGAWESGRVEGIRARGGLSINMEWKDGSLREARITADRDHAFTLVYGASREELELKKGEVFSFRPLKPNKVVPTAVQYEYQQMELVGFIHFTMNTFTDKEWGFGDEDPALFDPTELDTEQWVLAAKAAGLRQLILTAKHHDGFCLWPSAYTKHSIKSSPYKDGKGDIVREFTDACRRHGLRPGLYLSPWDRNHPDYGSAAYLDYYRKQLTELLTRYGEINEVWFDGANGGDGYYGGAYETRRIDKRVYYDWDSTFALVKSLQPGIKIFSDAGPEIRWVGNEHGHAGETFWSTIDPSKLVIGGSDPEYLNKGEDGGSAWIIGQCDVSIRPGWFYHASQDSLVKSANEILDIYYKSVGRNGLLLLNLPPDRRGLIHETDVAYLKEFREILNETFSEDLALGSAGSPGSSRTTDGNEGSYWHAPEGSSEGTLTLEFADRLNFDRILLQEPIYLGQRVREFRVEALVDGQWETLYEGTTIGYKRLLRVTEVSADALRLVIPDANNSPAISRIGLFRASEREESTKD